MGFFKRIGKIIGSTAMVTAAGEVEKVLAVAMTEFIAECAITLHNDASVPLHFIVDPPIVVLNEALMIANTSEALKRS